MEFQKKEKVGMRAIKLFIGLGNPGDEYENTYHNVGYQAVDWLLGTETATMKPAKGAFLYIKTESGVWIKPLVFMNESGYAVREALKLWKIKPEEMIVFHDDSDLRLGDFKISINRGAGGHKGVESIIASTGTKNFFRVRIGIRPEEKNSERRQKASELVLETIGQKNQKELFAAFENIRNALVEKKILFM